MSISLTRTSADATVPNAGTYEIDPTHSSATFQVRHLGLSKVRGGFDRFAGTIVVAEDPAASTVEVSLETASFSTGNADRDAHVKSAEFLDVEAHPEMTFRTTGVRQDGDDWKVDGDLTIRTVTRPVTIDVDFEGAGDDPWGNARIAFTGETSLNREDFGITWNQALEAGGVLVGKDVKIFLDVQAVATK